MDDLTKVGHVPKKQGLRKPRADFRKYHCVDHTAFKESCHACLVRVCEGLTRRIEELEWQAHTHEEQPPSIPYSVRGKIEPGTGLPYI